MELIGGDFLHRFGRLERVEIDFRFSGGVSDGDHDLHFDLHRRGWVGQCQRHGCTAAGCSGVDFDGDAELNPSRRQLKPGLERDKRHLLRRRGCLGGIPANEWQRNGRASGNLQLCLDLSRAGRIGDSRGDRDGPSSCRDFHLRTVRLSKSGCFGRCRGHECSSNRLPRACSHLVVALLLSWRERYFLLNGEPDSNLDGTRQYNRRAFQLPDLGHHVGRPRAISDGFLSARSWNEWSVFFARFLPRKQPPGVQR